MAFDGLSEKLNGILKKLSGKGKVSEKDVQEAAREVRMALLEADVNYKVARDFVSKITQRAVGQEVLESLTPGQQVIKVVHEELTALMGSTQAQMTFSSKGTTVWMMAGLQGAGKTTMCGKLAGFYKKQGKGVMLVACDVYRPAAIKQLQVVAGQVGVPVFEQGQGDPVEIARAGIREAKIKGYDLVIIDTAGRLHIDEEMMAEIKAVRAAVMPHEVLLVVDAMTGQDAVNVAQSFNEALGVDGLIMTKLDSDTRGGAALSARAVTGKPVKWCGTGEKLSDIEPFYPERMASRILGMGDVLTLIEKAQSVYDDKSAAEMEQKLRSQNFTLEDFLQQFEQVEKMGGIGSLLGMMPGMGQIGDAELDKGENMIKVMKAVIHSMTPRERRNPDLLNASRRRRIAAGSGTRVQDVNQVIKQYETTRQMMKQMMAKGKGGKRKGMMGLGKGMPKMPFGM